MGNRDIKAKSNRRKEKLSDFFFSLSNTVFGSLVIGVMLMMLEQQNNYNQAVVYSILIVGLAVFFGLAKAGDKLLK